MSEDTLVKAGHASVYVQWYEDTIPVRGCHLTLPQVKAAYRELLALTRKEGQRMVASRIKPEDLSDDEFERENAFLREDAFKLTASLIGVDGETAYGESEDIFDSTNLPLPLRTIFFTNVNSFRRHANGNEPPNKFSVYLHFDKPPLFDPQAVLSEPTPNSSHVVVHAEDVTYIRAVQNIVSAKLTSRKRWYSGIHAKFTYDLGLWLFGLPYALYWVTVFADRWLPVGGDLASFRWAFYIYGLGVSLFLYRAFFGYIKWAFPVNVLEENKDRALMHRVFLGTITLGLVGSWVQSALSKLASFG